MFKKILAASDGSALSAKAVVEAARLAKALGSELTIVSVTATLASLGDSTHAFAGLPEELRRRAMDYLEADARAALTAALAMAKNEGSAARTVLAAGKHPHEVIIETAKTEAADLIVMGSHGRSGLSSMLLGSVTQKVLAHTELPVLVWR